MVGRFITFEGLDGSGKSTHLHRAGEWLEHHGLPCVVTKEPGGTPLGEAIRGVFLDPQWGSIDGRVEAMLVFASRRQHLVELIDPALAAGQHVLCDRFTDSSMAYQGRGRGLSPAWIDELDRLVTDSRRPDITLLFDLPAEMAHGRGQSPKRRARGDADRIDVETLEFYHRVRERYLEIAEGDPGRVRLVDSGGSKEATWRQVEKFLEQAFVDHLAASPREEMSGEGR